MFDAVIIAYNPDIDILVSNVCELINCEAVSKIYLIDNSEGKLLFSFIDPRVVYYPQYINQGIAKAQNLGIELSLKNDKTDAVVLFDQDSILCNEELNFLYNDFVKIKEKSNSTFAAVGPQIMDCLIDKRGENIYNTDEVSEDLFQSVGEIIASGKMINKAVVNSIGLMDESLFIDGVDLEWCWRANNFGYKVYVSKNAKIYHTIGDSIWSCCRIKIRVSSPIRMYYQYRNFILLLRSNYTPLSWKFRSFVSLFTKFFVFYFILPDRKERRKYISSGILDGIMFQTGKYRNN